MLKGFKNIIFWAANSLVVSALVLALAWLIPHKSEQSFIFNYSLKASVYLLVLTILLLAFLYGVWFKPYLVKSFYKFVSPFILVVLLLEAMLQFFVFVPDPLLTLHRPNTRIHFEIKTDSLPGLEPTADFTTDAKGFRVSRPIDYNRKGAKTRRLFFIGGSTTESLYIDDKKTFTALLEQKLNESWAQDGLEAEVINTGKSGTRSADNYRVAREMLFYQPDYLVVLTGLNDLMFYLRKQGQIGSDKVYLSTALRPKSERYWLTRSKIARVFYAFWQYRQSQDQGEVFDTAGALYDELRFESQSQPLVPLPENLAEVPDFFRENIQAFINLARESNVKLVLLTQPTMYFDNMPLELERLIWMTPGKTPFRYSPGDLSFLMEKYNDILRAAAKDNPNVDLVDLAKLLPKDSTVYYDGVHFNVAGSAKIADILAEYFKESLPF